MKISDSFVANLVFHVGAALSMLPLTFFYLVSSFDPLVVMLVGIGGMCWLCSGFLMVNSMDRAFKRQAAASVEYLDRCLGA